jgi:hypothetical protein
MRNTEMQKFRFEMRPDGKVVVHALRFTIHTGDGGPRLGERVYARGYATVEEAESAARRYTAKHDGELVTIYDNKINKDVARTCRDPLDRIWTDVLAAPGQVTLL